MGVEAVATQASIRRAVVNESDAHGVSRPRGGGARPSSGADSGGELGSAGAPVGDQFFDR